MRAVLIWVMICPSLLYADHHKALEVTYKDRSITHQYTLMKGRQGSEFVLSLDQKSDGPRVDTILQETQVQLILKRAQSIIWKAQQKNQRCTHYAVIKTAYDEAIICQEDSKSVGGMYSFLQLLYEAVSNQ